MTATPPAAKVRIALLGCGRIARLAHLEILRSHAEAQLVAVAESNAESRAYASANAPGVEVFDDFHTLFRECPLDAAVIALPTTFHCEAALAALSAGVHLYLEKPVAASLGEARAVHAAWEATGRTGRIGFNARFGPLYSQLKNALARGEIGKPIGVQTAFTARYPGEATWRVSPSSGGGALLELASHHVDLMRFLFETDVASVAARTWSNRGDDESAMLDLTMRDGLHVQTLVAYGTIEEDRLEIYGSEGKLTVNRYDSLAVAKAGPYARGGLGFAVARLKSEIAGLSYGMMKRRSPGEEPSFAASLDDFVTAVRSGIPSRPDLTDGLRAMEVIDAARRSAVEKRTVELGE